MREGGLGTHLTGKERREDRAHRLIVVGTYVYMYIIIIIIIIIIVVVVVIVSYW